MTKTGMKPLNEYGFTEFKSAVLNSAKVKDNWFFSQCRDAYYADYRPRYPERTAADFTVCLDHGHTNSRVAIYADTATLPIIKQYSNMQDLQKELSEMER